MTTLQGAAWHDAFVDVLLRRAPAQAGGQLASIVGQPGFAVYRNTFMKACVDALRGNYPVVARLVGEEWFSAAAASFLLEQPPSEPMLSVYGEGFSRFLESFEPARELPYLPGAAALDRAWTECHVAADAVPLNPAMLAEVAPDVLEDVRLQPHPAARWRWFEEQPVYSIWSINRMADPDDAGEITWQAEGALLTRPCDAVLFQPLNLEACRFMDACARGDTLAAAAASALAGSPHDPATTLTQLLSQLLNAGAFTRLSMP